MAEWRRCRLSSADKDADIDLDLLIHDGRVCYGQSYFGIWRQKGEGSEAFPLSLIADGDAVDFGVAYDTGAARYGKMPIIGHAIAVNASFIYTEASDVWEFTVVSMTDLAARY